MKTGVIALVVVAIFALIWFVARRETNPAWEIGGLYLIRDSERQFRVAKVLAIDPGVVSIRMYKQTFDARPSIIDPAKLSLGSINDADGFGIGHLPLDAPTFSSWEPQFLLRTSLTDEELEGYRMWEGIRRRSVQVDGWLIPTHCANTRAKIPTASPSMAGFVP